MTAATQLADVNTGLSLTARGLAKSFGPNEVLKDLDLHIPAGQFVAIVGRSGCGKSTLLRLLAGLDTPSDGVIRIGDDHDSPEAHRDDARVMLQEPRLLPWARVVDNVAVGLGADRKRPDARQRVQEALAAVGLKDRGNDWPAVLSGGQKQRVALARALVSRPRFLALDEPLGALDALTRIEMQGLLERVWKRQGFTAVLITHDVSEALTLADRVVMIEDGRITMDIEVNEPRPRPHGSLALAPLEAEILGRLIHEIDTPPDYVI